MHAQEISLEVPSPVALRAPCEGSQNGWKKPERFSARQKTEVVLRLLRGGSTRPAVTCTRDSCCPSHGLA